MSQTVERAYEYRFYPTPEHSALLRRAFGCVRLVWDKALAERTCRYRNEGLNTSYVDTAKWLTVWNRDPELEFPGEVSNAPLRQTPRAQQAAFGNFFARASYPRFTSQKRCRRSAAFANNAFSFRDGRLKIAKMPGPPDIVWAGPHCDTTHDREVNAARHVLAVGLAES